MDSFCICLLLNRISPCNKCNRSYSHKTSNNHCSCNIHLDLNTSLIYISSNMIHWCILSILGCISSRFYYRFCHLSSNMMINIASSNQDLSKLSNFQDNEHTLHLKLHIHRNNKCINLDLHSFYSDLSKEYIVLQKSSYHQSNSCRCNCLSKNCNLEDNECIYQEEINRRNQNILSRPLKKDRNLGSCFHNSSKQFPQR